MAINTRFDFIYVLENLSVTEQEENPFKGHKLVVCLVGLFFFFVCLRLFVNCLLGFFFQRV